ncbi:MAG: hypothetical protein Q9187_000078 [Circinaria calcarea]
MSFFGFLQKPGSKLIKPQPLQIRREITVTEVLPARSTLVPSSQRQNGRRSTPGNHATKHEYTDANPQSSRSKAARKRATPEQAQKLSSDGSESDTDVNAPPKKLRSDHSQEPDWNRRVRSREAFVEGNNCIFPMVHAADISLPNTYIKYLLVQPEHGNDDFKPLEDIIEVMHKIAEHYLPQEERERFDNENSGFPQRLSRAIKRESEKEFRTTINEWNNDLIKLRDDGTIAQVLDKHRGLDSSLVERILTQTYSRTVSPRVSSLREYENGTDNVYGELLPKFISMVLKDTRLRSDQIFVDLGSGVGNVVLQAALEIGCESWGCEMMKNACDLADLQREEFKARCRLWGLAVGNINLERGDFLTNGPIGRILQKADVVLVNNQAFTPELNEGLIRMFLDLKEGCRIVSLKSFVPASHKITARNLNSPYNVLRVEEKEYFSGCVSWTNAPGTYYVSTKDTRQLRAFVSRNKRH